MTLSACGTVKIYDAEWCGDMGTEGAACFHTLSDKEREMSKPLWDIERFGMLCTKADSFANWKTAILALCDRTKQCSFEEREQVERLYERVDAFAVRTVGVKHEPIQPDHGTQ